MEIIRMAVGDLFTNCYIIYDKEGKEGIIVDPGGDGKFIVNKVKHLNVKIKYIVFTHVHFDHILGYHDVKNAFSDAELLVSVNDAPALNDETKSLMIYSGQRFEKIEKYTIVKENDTINFGKYTFKIIETPGHTEGSICLYGNNILISGDTLFNGSIGRWDFPGGSLKKEVDSITGKLFKLPKETIVYPGHGDHTTIGYEIENNDVAAWI